MWDIYMQTETGLVFVANYKSLYRAKAEIAKLSEETEELYILELNDSKLIEEIIQGEAS